MAPRNKEQKCTKKNPVRKSRPRRIKKSTPCCNGLLCSVTTKQSKFTVTKPNAKCPYCNGAGRVIKKKGKRNKKPTSYFPYFFQQVAKRARENNVVQLRKITMQRAAECWRTLTLEQKAEFIRKVQQNLGISGGRSKGSGSPAPGYRGGAPISENHQNAESVVAGKWGNVLEDNRQDARPAASEYVFSLASSPKNPKPGKPGNGRDVPNAPRDEKQVSLSPFGFFNHYSPNGDYM